MYDAITWMFAVGVVLALVVAYGLGANDVANMFGPSVGARALTMRQALLVAAVFEFSGAVAMGAGVADTIRSGITNLDYFTARPDILAYGMMCALAGTGVWMMVATYLELPVSSTQAIVASVAGMAVASNGWNAVVWSAPTSSFPYLKGMSAIALTWLFSPILAALASFLLFGVIRTFVLRHENCVNRSLVLLPLFVFVTFFVVTWFIIVKGGLQYGWQKTPNGTKAWISVVVAVVATLISAFVGIPLIKKKVQRDLDEQEAARKVSADVAADPKSLPAVHNKDATITVAGVDSSSSKDSSNDKPAGTFHTVRRAVQKSTVWRVLNYGLNYDIHKVVEEDQTIADLHAASERFEPKSELSFKYLQVCTACANTFAHGSNEVANAVGPLAAIYQIWRDSTVSAKNPVPTWLLAVGGAGLVFGLATMGYRVMRSMGVKMTRLTNSRGFCVELCVAAVVILASHFNIPMSSTPATVGAIAGVGLWEGRAGLNGRLVLKMVMGWVVTVVVSVFLTCVFMLQGLNSPSKNGPAL